jgi:hypothetical protein
MGVFCHRLARPTAAELAAAEMSTSQTRGEQGAKEWPREAVLVAVAAAAAAMMMVARIIVVGRAAARAGVGQGVSGKVQTHGGGVEAKRAQGIRQIHRRVSGRLGGMAKCGKEIPEKEKKAVLRRAEAGIGSGLATCGRDSIREKEKAAKPMRVGAGSCLATCGKGRNTMKSVSQELEKEPRSFRQVGECGLEICGKEVKKELGAVK